MKAKENLTNINTWLRVAFIILFGIVFYIAFGWLIWLLVLFQVVTKLLTGGVNPQLLELSPKVTDYANDILRYVTFQSDQKPWPLDKSPSTNKEPEAEDPVTPVNETDSDGD